jgi:hypothetical protein
MRSAYRRCEDGGGGLRLRAFRFGVFELIQPGD